MARTVLDRLGSDLRIQVACALFAVAVSLVVVLVTRSVGAGGLVLSVFGLVLAGVKYRHEQVSLDR